MKAKIWIGLLGVLAAGCTTENDDICLPEANDGFKLASSEEQIITRSGDEILHFAENTKYLLYAVKSNTWGSYHDGLDGAEGTETATHYISYRVNEDRFSGEELSFYALTYGNGTKPVCQSMTSDNVPLCKLAQDASTKILPDLRRAYLPDRNSMKSGVQLLPFRHTLARLKFEVVKQDEGTDVTHLLDNIILTGISVTDYTAGNLNLATGVYDHTATDYSKQENRPAVTGISQRVTTSVAAVNVAGGTPASCLIFPTAEGATEGLQVTVSFKKNASATEETSSYRITVSDTDAGSSGGGSTAKPFMFQPNYEYTLTITLTNDKVQIITITPRRYDWINHDYDQTQYLGQPVTFNGVMWMDRNLGAQSADISTPENWEKARGYYYMYGRNIPYYVKNEVTGTDGIMRPKFYENDPRRCAVPYPYIEGHMNDAYVYSANSSGYAMNPDETTKIFKYIARPTDNWTTNVAYNWARTPANSPCPKGWKLPTTKDVLKIWVINETAGDWTFINHSGSSYTYTANNDPETGASTSYFCIKEGGKSWGTIYAIKYQGTGQAYRLKWTIEIVGDENINDNKTTGSSVYIVNRSNLVISRYPAESTYPALNSSNYKNYDWEYPTEVIRFPIMGYICNNGWGIGNVTSLVYPGMELMMLMNDTGVMNNATYAMKYSGSSGGRSIRINNGSGSLTTAGFQIRCVRDM